MQHYIVIEDPNQLLSLLVAVELDWLVVLDELVQFIQFLYK